MNLVEVWKISKQNLPAVQARKKYESHLVRWTLGKLSFYLACQKWVRCYLSPEVSDNRISQWYYLETLPSRRAFRMDDFPAPVARYEWIQREID